MDYTHVQAHKCRVVLQTKKQDKQEKREIFPQLQKDNSGI